jgi:hypothetical protein
LENKTASTVIVNSFGKITTDIYGLLAVAKVLPFKPSF